MIPIIIMICSIIFDGLLTNILPFTMGNLSIFTPLFTVVGLFSIYPFYRKKFNNYIILAIICGIIYDLVYTNLLFFNCCLFILVTFLTRLIYKNIQINYIGVIIGTLLIISFYEVVGALVIMVFGRVPITFMDILYKISHSLLLNIIYVELLLFIIRIMPKKYKSVDIN